ncbi:hypothetical protein ACFW38_004294, partial [Salmonella enterica]
GCVIFLIYKGLGYKSESCTTHSVKKRPKGAFLLCAQFTDSTFWPDGASLIMPAAHVGQIRRYVAIWQEAT